MPIGMLKTDNFAQEGRLDHNDIHAPQTISPNIGTLTTTKLLGGKKRRRGGRRK